MTTTETTWRGIMKSNPVVFPEIVMVPVALPGSRFEGAIVSHPRLPDHSATG